MNVKDFSKLIDNAPDVDKYGMDGWNLQRGLDVCVRIQEREGKPMSIRRYCERCGYSTAETWPVKLPPQDAD